MKIIFALVAAVVLAMGAALAQGVPVVGPLSASFTGASQRAQITCPNGQSTLAVQVPAGLVGTFTVSTSQTTTAPSPWPSPPSAYAPGPIFGNTIVNSGSLTVNMGSNYYATIADTTYVSGSTTVTWSCSAAQAPAPLAAKFDVRAFGARCDGSTDDSVAILSANAAASAASGQLFFPAGLTCFYNSASPIVLGTGEGVSGNGAILAGGGSTTDAFRIEGIDQFTTVRIMPEVENFIGAAVHYLCSGSGSACVTSGSFIIFPTFLNNGIGLEFDSTGTATSGACVANNRAIGASLYGNTVGVEFLLATSTDCLQGADVGLNFIGNSVKSVYFATSSGASINPSNFNFNNVYSLGIDGGLVAGSIGVYSDANFNLAGTLEQVEAPIYFNNFAVAGTSFNGGGAVNIKTGQTEWDIPVPLKVGTTANSGLVEPVNSALALILSGTPVDINYNSGIGVGVRVYDGGTSNYTQFEWNQTITSGTTYFFNQPLTTTGAFTANGGVLPNGSGGGYAPAAAPLGVLTTHPVIVTGTCASVATTGTSCTFPNSFAFSAATFLCTFSVEGATATAIGYNTKATTGFKAYSLLGTPTVDYSCTL
jgi:hypothetical protein